MSWLHVQQDNPEMAPRYSVLSKSVEIQINFTLSFNCDREISFVPNKSQKAVKSF